VTELVIRLIFSLAVVVGLLLLLARVANRRFQGRTGAAIRVVHRQSLSRSSGVAVVAVGDRMLLLGTTEQQITLLTELEPGSIELPADQGAALPASGPSPVSATVAATQQHAAPAFEEHLEASLGIHHDPALGQDLVADLVRVATAEEPRVRPVPTHRAAPQPTMDGPLAGSVLSAQTWRQALKVARGTLRNAS
jgi:flagellar protein FliO/FliZ